MPDFLLELLSEEIPARMQARATADLARLFEQQIAEAGLKAESVETFATPRRLALIARGLPAETAALREEVKGPRANAPPQALEGFLRKTGLAREQLVERDGILFAVVEKAGRATTSVLAEAVPALVRAFPWPKSMRWGEASLSTDALRWVRPLHGIVALFGEDIVEFEIAGIRSGAATLGHRFHHPGAITIGSAHDYVEKLRACHVVLDPAERRRIIAEGAARAAAAEGLTLAEDEGLLAENAGLTEWPVPLLGSFDPAFLDVPREVIQLTMRTNQKYFALTIPPRNGEGDQPKAGGGAGTASALAPNFVCVANIEASDGGQGIVAGNRKVLAARLADARYFWEHDLKIPLEEQAKKLDQIVFHEKLGTVADKVERVASLARKFAKLGIVKGADEDAATRAAHLAKADLVSGMVGEFPELQGVMGGYYARAQGEGEEIADAIRDHYKPTGQGDDVPTQPLSVAVSLADKLDTLVGFFAIDERPTGSRDPFALRRAALGVIELILANDIRVDLWELVTHAVTRYNGQRLSPETAQRDFDDHNKAFGATIGTIPDFIWDRLKVRQREYGVRHDFLDAIYALDERSADIVQLLARVRALQAFVVTSEGADLLAGYKRAANILKKENWDATAQDGALPYAPASEEAALIAALEAEKPKADAAIAAEDFEGAMAALASLRAPVDAFFDKVTVNDPDPVKREARLNLLARMRDAVHRVADFSKIEG